MHAPAVGDVVAQLLHTTLEERLLPTPRMVMSARHGQAGPAERRGVHRIGVYGSSERLVVGVKGPLGLRPIAFVIPSQRAPLAEMDIVQMGYQPVVHSPEQFDAFIRSEITKRAAVIEQANVHIDRRRHHDNRHSGGEEMKSLLRAAAVLSLATLALTTSAQSYPTRPIRVLIPFTAGSAADIIARAMEPQLREKLGQSLVIDNRGGAGGNIAAEMTAKSAPDGYTLMMGTIGTHAINYSLYSKLPYHPIRDFTPIALVGDSPNVLVINPKVPANSIQELIALAKAHPGQLNYGSSGAGTSVHLSAELFSTMAGIKMVHVPFKGATEALTALLGGQLDLMFASLSSSIPLIKQGRLKAFAVTGAQRSPSIPELPTISEAALPGYAAAAWYGLVGPAGIPRPIVATLSNASLATIAMPEVKDRLFASGVEVRPGNDQQFAKLIASEVQKWAKVVKDSGAKVE